jgi:hypothetical protein
LHDLRRSATLTGAALAAALRAGTPPTEVVELSPFSPSYVRALAREYREYGVPAAPGGVQQHERPCVTNDGVAECETDVRMRWTSHAPVGDAGRVNYVEAAAAVTSDLESGVAAGSERAALRLALLAWRELGDTDVAWDRFGLDLLAISEMLRDLPDVAVFCDPPSRDDPQVPATVARLVAALAARLDRAASDDERTLVDRLSCDAAAAQLRRTAATLP